ncbi:MAG: T9SS type A sorting domain-containing protein [Cyclobacteriaceae bacterium]|nr:T9SS type A sorting domain-containing protein [Cyclobacteriaceae bacterium]
MLVGKGSGALEYFSNVGNGNFELTSGAYLGIDRDFSGLRRNLVPSVGDIDGDGLPDLITTDSRGMGSVYFAFQAQSSENPVAVEIACQNQPTGQVLPIAFDSKTWIAPADIFGLGSASLVVGGIRGGLQIFKNPSGGISDGDGDLPEVSVYPNPAGQGIVHFKSNMDVTVKLVSLLGQQISAPFEVKKYVVEQLDIGLLGNGMYVLQIQNARGATSSKLFMVLQ